MRRSFLILTLLLVAGALAAAGCGSSNSGGASSTGGGATTTSSSGGGTTTSSSGGTSTTPSGGAVAVAMQNIAFSPGSVTVKVGQKITWTNDDSVVHNVTSTSGEHIASSDFGNGGTFSFTPTKAGTIDYTCTIHPGMNGKIVVTK